MRPKIEFRKGFLLDWRAISIYMALTTRRIAPDSDPKLKKAQVLNPYHSGDEFRRISSDRSIDEVSGSDFARARPSRWGARSEAWGRLGGGRGAGANTRAPTPSANNPIKPNFYHLVRQL